MKIYSGSVAHDALSPFGVAVQRWSVVDVRNWLFGLGDFIVEYLPNFQQIDGNALLTLFNDDLKDLGVENWMIRRKICSFLKQLTHLCYDAEEENLQILIASVGTLAKNLYNELRRHTKRERALPLNFISLCDNLDQKVKKLLSWFDRPPFLGQERFCNLRKSISTITLDILDWNLNDNTLTKEQCRQLITSLQISCAQLYTLCDKILQESCDVLLIQNAYFESCYINRKSPDIDLGIFFDTIENRHIVKSLKFQSPADLATKIDVGDEILDVNGQIVVGWTHENVQNRLFHLKSMKITFLLKKQPRDSWNIFKLSAPRQRKITIVAAATPLKIAGGDTVNSPLEISAPANSDDDSAIAGSKSTSSTLERVKRRRSSSFSHGLRAKIDENSSQNEEFTTKKTTRKWKSVKAPTVPLRNFCKTTTTPLPRSRRITVSGGSPTLKRLSLHVHDRKCSLMPQEKANVANLESPQIKQKLTQLFSAAVNQSTSSSTDDGRPSSSNILRSPLDQGSWSPDDDVFVNAKMNVERRRDEIPFEDGSFKDENDNRSSGFGQKTINLTEFSTVTAGPLIPADDVLWIQKTKIVEKPRKYQNQNFDFKGVVDFDGATILPNLVNEISKKKIERFFGENFDESMEKINSSDNVSTFSSDEESSKNRSRRSSSPPKISPKSPCSQKSLKLFHQKDSSFKKNILLEDSMSSTGSQVSLLSKNPHRFLWRYWKNSNLSLNANDQKSKESSKMTAYTSLNNEKLSASFFEQSEVVDTYRDYSGWLFRYKLPDEIYSHNHHAPKHQTRWLIRWAVLRNDIFQLYVSKEDSRPEGVICLNGCKVRPCPSAALGSSKKNIFQIVYENVPFYFHCPERKDMIEWLNKLGLSAIGYSKPKMDAIFKGFYFERLTNHIPK